MKKIFFIFFLILFTGIKLFGQYKDDFRLMFYTGVNFNDETAFTMGGLSGELFVSDKISLNYKYGFGSINSDEKFVLHFPAPILLVALLPAPEALLLAVFLPEGVGYHFYASEKMEVSPYLSPLGMEVIGGDKAEAYFTGTWGCRFHIKPIEQLTISPDLGATIRYGKKNLRPHAEVSLGWKF